MTSALYFIPLFLSLLLWLLYILISSPNFWFNSNKSSPFECGFDRLTSPRKAFSLRFYLLLTLFLIFDIEVVLLFPLLSKFCLGDAPMLVGVLFSFVMFLLVGLFHEWYQGVLDWVK